MVTVLIARLVFIRLFIYNFQINFERIIVLHKTDRQQAARHPGSRQPDGTKQVAGGYIFKMPRIWDSSIVVLLSPYDKEQRYECRNIRHLLHTHIRWVSVAKETCAVYVTVLNKLNKQMSRFRGSKISAGTDINTSSLIWRLDLIQLFMKLCQLLTFATSCKRPPASRAGECWEPYIVSSTCRISTGVGNEKEVRAGIV